MVTTYARYFKMGGKEQQALAFEAVKASFLKTGIEEPYNLTELLSTKDFESLAEYLGWGIILQNPTNPDSPISGIEFIDEKLHEKVATQFFSAIAEFIQHGSYVVTKDQSGVFTSWEFEDGKVEVIES